jgi:hypothetical protein
MCYKENFMSIYFFIKKFTRIKISEEASVLDAHNRLSTGVAARAARLDPALAQVIAASISVDWRRTAAVASTMVN